MIWLIYGLCATSALAVVSAFAARDFMRLNRESLDGWSRALDGWKRQEALTREAMAGWRRALDLSADDPKAGAS